LLYGLRKNYCQ